MVGPGPGIFHYSPGESHSEVVLPCNISPNFFYIPADPNLPAAVGEVERVKFSGG